MPGMTASIKHDTYDGNTVLSWLTLGTAERGRESTVYGVLRLNWHQAETSSGHPLC